MKIMDRVDVNPEGTVRPPIAIVGIGCRFPGGIDNPRLFWRFLAQEGDAIQEIPPGRLDVDFYYDPQPATPGKMMTRWGGFLGRVDLFDAGFFGISPREAERMDPQQRLLLEVAWEALEDAGQPVTSFAGSHSGVFIGLWLSDYESRLFANPDSVDFYMTTGTGRYSASGRLSYVLGLQGPSLTVDTACSSSLVAVHLACQSIWANECPMALAGGANVILQPHISIAYSQSKMMAPDGRCKFGDARADGYVRSEGAGIVVLKPLAAALKAGDPIYALIRGSAVNNDGSSSGYMTTPGRHGQENLLRRAYKDAGFSPGQVLYVEAHGTGTRVGDPVEIGALGNVLSSDRAPGSVCYVGSVKTNFGHTEGAAGIAGLIKTALVLKHQRIPASLHLCELNPAIPWKEYPLAIPGHMTPFPPSSGPAVAGVSAFGITGTNAHIVLEQAPRQPVGLSTRPDSICLLPLSARSPQSLTALARACLSALSEEQAPPLSDTCYTAALHRTHHEYRAALVAGSRADMKARLRAFLQEEQAPGVWAGKADQDHPPKVVFVFPGQGSQWVGMGRQLKSREPAFGDALERCEQAMRPFVDWSLREQLDLDPEAPGYRLNEIDVIQPTLLSFEIALAAMWRSWGVQPHAVVGHSMGEVAAAYEAEALSLEDAMRIICTRSSLLQRRSGKGAMAVVGLPMGEASDALAGFEDCVSVAVSNSPRSTVLSGDPAALETILARLQASDVFCRQVKVDVASHSPQMDLLTDDLLRSLETIRPREEKVSFYSTVTAGKREGSTLDARYWVQNLRCPVLFSQTVHLLIEDEHTVFIELSPHPVLLASIEETIQNSGAGACGVSSLDREKDEQAGLLASLGKVYTIGCPVNWRRLFPLGGTVVSLPAYPWHRQSYWLDIQPSTSSRLSGRAEGGAADGREYPLLGTRLPEIANQPGTFHWQNAIPNPVFSDFLRKHLVEGSPQPADDSPLPEDAYVAMASAAARVAFGDKLLRISGLVMNEPLLLLPGAGVEVQSILTMSGAGRGSFQVFSRRTNGMPNWTSHISGNIEAMRAEANWLYDSEWKKKTRQLNGPEFQSGRITRWLIFADRDGLGSKLAELLEARGDDCVLVFAGDSFHVRDSKHFRAAPGNKEDMTRLLAELRATGSCSGWGLLYLWALDSAPTPGLTATSLESAQALSCDGVLHLIQSVASMEWKPARRLWLITRGAQQVEPGDGVSLSLAQAPLWGLGRVISLEYTEFWGGLVDLPPRKSGVSANEMARTLCQEILGCEGEDQVALREERYVARLVRSHDRPATRSITFLPDVCYLITGGLGSLGLRLAAWLVSLGARNLVLTGRKGLPERSAWPAISPDTETGKRIAAIQALEQRGGANIHVVKADIADARDMSGLWGELDRNHPPVRGIIHAAGILTPRGLADLQAEEFHDVLRSKVTGAWLLHEFAEGRKAAGRDLDFFVLFSSGASVWGGQGLGHYAAANHFLDVLAQHRGALGLPALSVNWGWWEGAGIVSEEQAGLFGRMGLKSLPTEPALEVLAYLLASGATRKTVADVDWTIFGPIFEARRNRPLLEEVFVRARSQAEAGAAGGDEGMLRKEKRSRFLDRILQAPRDEKRPLLHSFIRDQVGQILGFASSDGIDPRQGFFKMGMDSMMTVQLRNRLDQSLGQALPQTVAFEYPTVESLTKFIAEAVLNLEAPTSAPINGFEEKPKAAGSVTDSLSEEQLEELLARRLEQIQ